MPSALFLSFMSRLLLFSVLCNHCSKNIRSPKKRIMLQEYHELKSVFKKSFIVVVFNSNHYKKLFSITFNENGWRDKSTYN